MVAVDPMRERIAQRLMRLLEESEDAEAEMRKLLVRFQENGLWNGPMNPAAIGTGWPRFHVFAEAVIVENWLVHEALAEGVNYWDPDACETVGDLTSHILPPDSHLD